MISQAFKGASWNVNGIRSCLTKGFWEWYQAEACDFVALQECKITLPDFLKWATFHDIEVVSKAYDSTALENVPHKTYAFFNPAQKAGYSGVTVFTKMPPLSVEFGLGNSPTDNEGRVIFLHYKNFTLINVYIPNAGRELEKLDKKTLFFEHFFIKLKALQKKQPHIIVCGDFNVAPEEIDLKNPKTNQRNAGFTIEERTCFKEWLKLGYADVFRHFYPDLKEAYTWWSYRFEARQRNIGWRLDGFVCTQDTLKHLTHIEHQTQVLGSDHCPVVIKGVL